MNTYNHSRILIVFCLLSSLACFSQKRDTDTVLVLCLVSDTSLLKIGVAQNTSAIKCKAVREKHNTSEGVADAGGMQCIDDNGNFVPCFNDYWIIVKYLLPKRYHVWESEIIKEKK